MARKRTLFAALAAAAAAAVIVTVAAVWPGLDAQQTPPVDTGVWALQTADGRRYARVNTGLGELDTVRGVSNPSSVVQNGDGAYLFPESLGKVTRVNEAPPLDLDRLARLLGSNIGVADAEPGNDVFVAHQLRRRPVDNRADAELLMPRRA